MKVIELSHIEKKIAQKHILSDISFFVNKGEVFGFI